MLDRYSNQRQGLSPYWLLLTVFAFCRLGYGLDATRYISIDEIKPGMQAYCLTVYKGTEVEKFELEVLDVVRGLMPGRDAILVQGKDERFVQTGPVGGCSGSPVYIDGRLAGALAFGFSFSKDPFYGVTPIEEMLKAGRSPQYRQIGPHEADARVQPGFVFDLSKPLDLAEIHNQIATTSFSASAMPTGVAPLPCPMVVSGLPVEVTEQIDSWVRPFGLMAVAGMAVSADGGSEKEDIELVPGACLAVPLVTGDVKIDLIGTVTEVVGDQVYGFGHHILGYGPTDLPMGTGRVHAVVSNVRRSFKFATAVDIVGAFKVDESTAARGQLGVMPRMIPMTVQVDRYNDLEKRVFNCRIAHNRLLTPRLINWVVVGTTLTLGMLPPNHMVEYKVRTAVENAEPLVFENVSTALGLKEIVVETVVPVAMLMNNPYRDVKIESIDVEVKIAAKNVLGHIWSAELVDSQVKAGESVQFGVVVESFLGGKKKYEGGLHIPTELRPGKYELLVCGGSDYLKFLRLAAPHRFIAQNFSGLLEALNYILQVRRDKLYCVLTLPPGGMTLEKAELPDLPATKALVLQDATRTLKALPFREWIERSYDAGNVLVDKETMYVTVEK
jgi:hypothetical protein